MTKEKTDLFRPTIIDFENAALFLRAQFQYLKTQQKGFSFQYCAKRMKTSPSYLKSIIQGRRNLSLDKIASLCLALKLNTFEKQYLTILVVSQQCRDERILSYFSDILKRLQHEWRNDQAIRYLTQSDGQKNTPLSHWLYAVIFELVRLPNFTDNAKWIHSQLIDSRVSHAEIVHCLDYLKSNEILLKTKSGWTTKNQTQIANPFYPNSLTSLSGNFQKTCDVLQNAAPYKKCRFYTATAAISSEVETALFSLIYEFEKKVNALCEQVEKPDRVVAISLGAFNTVKIVERSE